MDEPAMPPPKPPMAMRVMCKHNVLGRRRSEKAAQAAAKAHRERHKLLRMAQIVLAERYRAVIRAQTLENCRRNINVIATALPDICKLKRARNEALVRLINANVAIMVEQLHKLLQKIDEIFAQHNLPMNVSLERSQHDIRAQIHDMYVLFYGAYCFDADEDEIFERKFLRFSHDFLALPLLVGGSTSKKASGGNNTRKTTDVDRITPPVAVPSDDDNETIESVTSQRNNLIAIIEQEDIRTIAIQQTLQERIDVVDAKIAALTLRVNQLSGSVSPPIK